jgi:hypothetical protein
VGLVYSQTGSGLVIASQGADEAACRAALKQHDPDLCLVPQDSDAFGRRIYKVYRRVNAERSEFVCFWGNPNTLEPYPLSVTGLLEMVKSLDRNGRGDRTASLAELERRAAEERYKDGRRDLDAIVDEFADRINGRKSSPLPRSQSLRRARDRVRARTKTKEFRP